MKPIPASTSVEYPDSAWFPLVPWIFVVLWSGGFACAKIGLLYAEPLTFLALRYLILVGILGLAFLVMRPPMPTTRRAWIDQIIVGFLIQGLYFILTYFAFIQGVSAGTFGVIVSLQPIIVGCFAARAVSENVSSRQWIGLLIGLAGAILTISASSTFEHNSILGLILSVGALFGMTAGTLYEKRYGVPQHPITANFIQYAVGFGLCAPCAFAFETLRVEFTTPFIAAMAYLVIANSIISITLLLAMIRKGEVARVSSLFFLVPPTAALGAWILMGEKMPNLAWVGMAIAGIGVAMAGGASWRGQAKR
jgi:drug/metabolite transporter (DMT)-like permease